MLFKEDTLDVELDIKRCLGGGGARLLGLILLLLGGGGGAFLLGVITLSSRDFLSRRSFILFNLRLRK